MDVEQKALDVATGGAAQVALAALADDTCSLEWPPCSTLLARLTENDICVEPVARLRASGRAAPAILLTTLLNHGASTHSRIQAAEAIVSMLEHPELGGFVLGCLQGVVSWSEFRDVLDNGHDLVLKGYIALVAMHLLSKVYNLQLVELVQQAAVVCDKKDCHQLACRVRRSLRPSSTLG